VTRLCHTATFNPLEEHFDKLQEPIVSFIRILVVEDFEPFRRFLRRALQPRPEFKIVGEALDGLEAVRKATDLQPDLILIDIGLPKLNGIAAAEQIRMLVPDARLLFISLESSPYMVQEAFRSGANGYVDKTRAHLDLIPAIETVLAGKQFLSNNLELSGGTRPHRRHEAQFYSDEVIFLETATRFVAGALKENASVVVIATPMHGDSLVQTLKAEAIDMDRAIQQGTYISLNANEVLSKIMVKGRLDHCRATEIVGDIVDSTTEAAKARNSRTAILGECSGLLCAEGDIDAAIEMEKRANDRIKTQDIDIFCPYPLSPFRRPDQAHAFKNICAEHTAVFSR
jgi:DNA-binding NarL/FixJ family response regulator